MAKKQDDYTSIKIRNDLYKRLLKRKIKMMEEREKHVSWTVLIRDLLDKINEVEGKKPKKKS